MWHEFSLSEMMIACHDCFNGKWAYLCLGIFVFTLFLLYKFGDFPCFLTMFCIMVQSFFQLIGRRPLHYILIV